MGSAQLAPDVFTSGGLRALSSLTLTVWAPCAVDQFWWPPRVQGGLSSRRSVHLTLSSSFAEQIFCAARVTEQVCAPFAAEQVCRTGDLFAASCHACARPASAKIRRSWNLVRRVRMHH